MVRGVPSAIVEMFRAIPLFSECSGQELRQIAGLGTQLPITEGKALTTQGKPGSEFFVLLQGRARCEIDGSVVAEFGPGDFFGEMALLENGPRTATVVAESALEVLVLEGREFRSLLEASPSITRKVLAALAARERDRPSRHS